MDGEPDAGAGARSRAMNAAHLGRGRAQRAARRPRFFPMRCAGSGRTGRSRCKPARRRTTRWARSSPRAKAGNWWPKATSSPRAWRPTRKARCFSTTCRQARPTGSALTAKWACLSPTRRPPTGRRSAPTAGLRRRGGTKNRGLRCRRQYGRLRRRLSRQRPGHRQQR